MVETATVPTSLLKQVAELRADTFCDSKEAFVANAVIAALLALGAALFIAVGDVIHQRSAHEVTDQRVGHLELFTRLLRDGRWRLGGPGGRRRIRYRRRHWARRGALVCPSGTAQPNTAA